MNSTSKLLILSLFLGAFNAYPQVNQITEADLKLGSSFKGSCKITFGGEPQDIVGIMRFRKSEPDHSYRKGITWYMYNENGSYLFDGSFGKIIGTDYFSIESDGRNVSYVVVKKKKDKFTVEFIHFWAFHDTYNGFSTCLSESTDEKNTMDCIKKVIKEMEIEPKWKGSCIF